MRLRYYIKFWFPERKLEDIMDFTENQIKNSKIDPRIKQLEGLHFQRVRKDLWGRFSDGASAEIITERVPEKCKKCGCNPELIWLDMFYFSCLDKYYVRCDNCDIETEAYFSEDQALDEWDEMNKN